jgi:hypothetical protein
VARQQRPITAREYTRLGEIGVLGERVELIRGWIVHGRYPYEFADEAISAARAAGIELTEPAGEASSGGAPMHPESIEAVAELTLRLARVMRPEYVMTWLKTTDAEALAGERPIDLIARGDIDAVRRLVSGLEDPGAV